MHARIVKLNRHGTLFENGQADNGTDQSHARLAHERAECVIGISDTAKIITAHDEITLRLQQASSTLCRFTQLPIVLEELFIARFKCTHGRGDRAVSR